jgi:hypothetical protein
MGPQSWHSYISSANLSLSVFRRYEEDEEDEYPVGQDTRWSGHRPPPDHDSESESEDEDECDEDDEDEDDVLEMRTPSSIKSRQSRSKSKSSSSSSTSSASNTSPGAQRRPPLRRNSSMDTREHVTIAPIAPTILKTTGVRHSPLWADSLGDDEYSDDGAGRWYPRVCERERERTDSSEGTPVELVYVPPLGSNYHVREDEREEEDFLPIPLVTEVHLPRTVTQRPAVVRADNDADADGLLGDAYDYFGGPDLGEDFTRSEPRPTRKKEDSETLGEVEGDEDDEALRFAHGVAESVTVGRSNVNRTTAYPFPSLAPPEVLVNGGTGADLRGRTHTRSRSRSRSKSGSRTPSPVELLLSPPISPPPIPSTRQFSSRLSTLPVPRTGRGRSASYSPPTLLPPPPRGRALLPASASASSLHGGRESVSQSRGRSSTRSPAISDREQSNPGSPLGSLSPDGSALALGAGIAGSRGYVPSGRERERESERGRERGRERTARRLGGSSSSEDVLAIGAGVVKSEGGSSGASGVSSAATVVAVANPLPVAAAIPGANANLMASAGLGDTLASVPKLTVELDREHRSPSSTPVKSPTMEMTSSPPPVTSARLEPSLSPPSSQLPSASAPTQPVRPSRASSSPAVSRGQPWTTNSKNMGMSRAGDQQQHVENGTFVTRAVGIMSSYLGLWHDGTA